MRHARPTDLDTIEPLLAQLRTLEGMKERTRGVFYRKSKSFLHFHEHDGAVLADVRGPDDWERFEMKKAKWPVLMRRVRALLAA